ncbi:MAG: ATP-binding protein [Halieaceae bacterium]|jgi:two-component system sensor histidine kinase PhoQ|nr:ATP-binding protein [Halieaceae bacterium]
MTARAPSLARRLLLAALVLMPLTLGATGAYLERAHREALDAAISERLQLQVITLLALADVGDSFELPLMPLESRLLQPGSGLYALVSDDAGELLWISPSAAFLAKAPRVLAEGIPVLAAGERHDSERAGLLRHAYQVQWELADGERKLLRFVVAESAAPRDADVLAFRKRLLLWLAGTLLVMLLAQLTIVRFGLQPLRRLAERISRVEAGEVSDLGQGWPREVEPLVENLEALLHGEQQRRERTRNTLADVAHSLKTPLAVLRSADTAAAGYPALHREQLERMEEVVQWHLQRAVGGNHRLLQRVAVMPVLERLRDTLLKVYAGRDLLIDIHGDATARYRGDERDLMELLGNLLDNACKYAAHRVRVTARHDSEAGVLLLVVEDDGDGISPGLRDALLTRGTRADTRQEGQGIGLAVVKDIVVAQQGELRLDDSELGGARVELRLP